MKLTYRGVAYCLPSAHVHFNSAKTFVGKYRGVPCSIQYSTAAPKHAFNLKYRGAYYDPGSVYPTSSGLAAI